MPSNLDGSAISFSILFLAINLVANAQKISFDIKGYGTDTVFLAKYKSGGNRYVALKVVVKKEIPNTKTDREHVQAEHFCLTHFGHPFLVKLYCSYQTPSKLIYAMEFLQGGELFSWMEKFQKF